MHSEGCNLKICISDKKKEIFIPHKSLFLNTLVLGNKGTGKSSLILRELAYQTITDRNVGGTFVVSSKDLSYELYILAKHHKRRVLFINPAVSNDVDLILNKEEINHDDLLEIYNFEKLIYNNYIVIVDIENVRTNEKGCTLVKCLLDNFKESMYKTDITCSRPHFLYVDDAFYYLDSLESILYYGNEYNIATTLFFQNRNQFKTKNRDYSSFLDSNIGNTILTNNLTHEDSIFYGEVLDINLSACSKSRGKIFYELKNKDGAKFTGTGEVKETQEINNIVYEELYSVKRALKRKKNKEQNKVPNNKVKTEISNNFNIDKSTQTSNHTNIEKSTQTSNLFNLDKSTDIFKDDDFDLNESINLDKVIDLDKDKLDFNTDNIECDNKTIPKSETLNEKKDINIFKNDIFDDGKIELSLDWDDYDF